ncbi:MAG: pyridoxal phosphate-dependent aminotransferase [Candidatus Altiarchaeota archaeon]|nr:pyridoxal phosphate-dependent aminotransferase [Candidatus Altiarchaeota archaeon]
MRFSSRLKGVDESATFKYSRLAKERKMINLTIGRTGFDTPPIIKEATKKALDEGKVHYTPTKGIPELRKAIARKLVEENKIQNLDEEHVLVSVGAKHVIYEAVMSIIQRGDVVAISNPSWVSYESIARLSEGRTAWIPLKPENGFIPDDDFYAVLEDSKPRMILINSPNNPTGAVYPEKAIRKVVDIAERNESIILSDEIYERIIYEGKHFSAGSIYEDTITVNGFSKEFSMTGWRLAYAASQNKEIIEKMDIIQAQTVSCAVSFIQYGALKAFTEEARRDVMKMIAILKKRRDCLIDGMKKTRAVMEKPSGAFYVFPFFEGADDIELADKLMDEGVGVIPGSPFGSAGHGCLRMSYGDAEIEDLRKAVDILKGII